MPRWGWYFQFDASLWLAKHLCFVFYGCGLHSTDVLRMFDMFAASTLRIMAIFLDNAAALEEDTWARKVGDEHEVGMSSFTFEEHDADTAHKVVSQQTLRKQKELAETALKSQVSIQCFGKLIYYIYIYSPLSLQAWDIRKRVIHSCHFTDSIVPPIPKGWTTTMYMSGICLLRIVVFMPLLTLHFAAAEVELITRSSVHLIVSNELLDLNMNWLDQSQRCENDVLSYTTYSESQLGSFPPSW